MGRNGVTSMRVVLGEIVPHRLEEGAGDGERLADHHATMRQDLRPALAIISSCVVSCQWSKPIYCAEPRLTSPCSMPFGVLARP